MTNYQTGIMECPPPLARHAFFSLHSVVALPAVLDKLAALADGQSLVVGLGDALIRELGADITGARPFPALSGKGVDVPSTQFALWCWLRGEDRSALQDQTAALQAALEPAFSLEKLTDAFFYRDGRDLTGYEDGTENPQGDEAIEAAFVADGAPGEAGGSFAAIQHWLHDLRGFETMPQTEQDNTIGRRKSDNEELEDAPESAHVKRTAQESFTPEAFILRRSMPWAEGTQAGLVFLAFGHSFDAFEAQMRRMVGLEDGIVDALFRFSKPISGGYYWCPPVADGHIDLTAVQK